MSKRCTAGFTLVEILIVVVILGILAAIVTPQFVSASESAKQASFVTSLKSFASAGEMYRTTYGMYPEDASTGQLPSGMERWIREQDWVSITPIGGSWDCERDDIGGYGYAMGVHFNGRGMALKFTPEGDRLLVSCLEQPPQVWDLTELIRPLSAVRPAPDR
jgi:prepilin-type N-terminal cleavage/methylation domain-containing protein